MPFPEQTSVINILTEAIADQLTEKLITELDDEVDPFEEGQAGVVRAGKLQDNPLNGRINILIHPGDDDWPHLLSTMDDGFYVPPYEIGQSYPTSSWRRRFYVKLKIFIETDDRDDARITSHVVFSRLHHAIVTMPIPTTPDSFGESTFLVQMNKTWLREGGGPGVFIWRGEARLEFLTTHEPTEG